MKSAGKRRSKSVGVLERVVELRGRHRPRVEPRVEHRLDAVRAAAATVGAARDHDVVDVGAVEVEVARGRGPRGARAPRPNRRTCRARSRGSATPGSACPSSGRGERPVDVVLEPVAEAAVLDVLGMPVDRLVLAEQLVLLRRRAHEPRGLAPVDERRVAAPAVGIRVRVVDDLHEHAARRERVDDRGVGVLDELAARTRASRR